MGISKWPLGLGLSLVLTALASGRASAQLTANLSPEELAQARANTFVREVGEPRTYGLANLTSHVLPWPQFVTILPNTAANQGITSPSAYRRYCPDAGTCAFDAPVFLPNGASVESVELEACDSGDPQNVVGVFFHVPVNGAALVLPPGGSFASTGTPGCVLLTSNLVPPVVVDNANNSYFFEVYLGNVGGLVTSFRSVRLLYRLQVSPAPAVATFPVDVPTNHPFFRFVEALASAGITAGCAPQSYCPNNPITRGEMAVFLAAALGLHFPN